MAVRLCDCVVAWQCVVYAWLSATHCVCVCLLCMDNCCPFLTCISLLDRRQQLISIRYAQFFQSDLLHFPLSILANGDLGSLVEQVHASAAIQLEEGDIDTEVEVTVVCVWVVASV